MGATLLYLWTTSRSTPTRSWGEFWSFINTSWNCDYHEIVMIMVTSTWRTVLMIMWFQFWWTRQYERYLQTSHLLDLGWKLDEVLAEFVSNSRIELKDFEKFCHSSTSLVLESEKEADLDNCDADNEEGGRPLCDHAAMSDDVEVVQHSIVPGEANVLYL